MVSKGTIKVRFMSEEYLGPFDGTQDTFQTSVDFVPGSLRVFAPILGKTVDSVELGTNKVVMAESPLEGDVLIFVYRSIVG